MTFKDALKRKIEDEGFLRKFAAAVLTPEAEQAAVQGGMGGAPMAPGMPPAGAAPMDPAAMQGGAPMDPAMMGGAPAPGAPQGSGGGQLPPEIMQDQGFLQWLQQMGIMFDPQSGMFYDPQGQPLPAEVIMQAYQQYQTEMQGAAAPQGAAPAGAPMDPAAMQGGAPMDPAAMGGAPAAGGLPPEVMQDEQFAQFMAGVGAQLDPNTGSFMDPTTGQPLPPEVVMQAYQAYQQQMGGAPMDGGAPAGGAMPEGGNEIPQEILDQIQSVVDASIQNFSAQLDKKIETLVDKLETVKMAIEAMRDTDDQRDKEEKDATKALQDEIAAELQPTVKEASVKPQPIEAPKPINMFEFIINSRKNK